MKIVWILSAAALMCVNASASSHNQTITNTAVTLKSTEHFTLLGDMRTTAGTKEGQDFKTVEQLSTKKVLIYPSPLSNRESIAGSGYLYICEVKILDQEWHPLISRRLLGNIGFQLSEALQVPMRSATDSCTSKAGIGMIHLLQGDKATLTLMLVGTTDKDVFHLCGTYTEAK